MKNELTDVISGALFTEDKLTEDILPSIKIKGKIVATPGNFICISGLPKSRKTTFNFGAIASFFLRQPVYDIQLINDNRPMVVIDTESSPYSFSKHIKSLKNKLGVDKIPSNLYSYLLRKADPEQIIKIIEATINLHSPGFVVIDNLTEMVINSIDPEEAHNFVKFLKRITEEKNITIIGLIHLSKSNNFTLGWLGSFTDRASQSTLKVTKDPETDVSTLEAVIMRDDSHFEPISIQFSNELNDYEVVNNQIKQEKPGKLDLMTATRQIVINATEIIFSANDDLKYDELVQSIKQTLNVGTNKSKTLVTWLLNQSYILKTNTGYKINPLN